MQRDLATGCQGALQQLDVTTEVPRAIAVESLQRTGGEQILEAAERGVEILPATVRIRQLGEGPAAVRAEAVDTGDPERVHRLLLHLGILTAKALDLDYQV